LISCGISLYFHRISNDNSIWKEWTQHQFLLLWCWKSRCRFVPRHNVRYKFSSDSDGELSLPISRAKGKVIIIVENICNVQE